ncbi:MAG: hypothetical protein R3213_06955 [Flavobacteriaceae bacterium]|nr:hypothetical protein [Flavobacteriaceae bacterium]
MEEEILNRVLKTLHEIHPSWMTASIIMIECGIPAADVFTVIDHLTEKGLVKQRVIFRPHIEYTEYAALKPQEVVKARLNGQRQ